MKITLDNKITLEVPKLLEAKVKEVVNEILFGHTDEGNKVQIRKAHKRKPKYGRVDWTGEDIQKLKQAFKAHAGITPTKFARFFNPFAFRTKEAVASKIYELRALGHDL